MNRKIRVSRCLLFMGIMILGLTLGMTCKKHGQSPSSFSVTFGDSGSSVGYSVWQTTDGGYIITGSTSPSGQTCEDVLLIKTDSLGRKEWDKAFGGTSQDAGGSVQQTSDGGYIIAGWTGSYGAGAYDVWLVKADASGNRVWDRIFGGEGEDWGSSVQQTLDGGYIVAGSTMLYGGYLDVWLIKTDVLGNEVWDKAFGGTGGDQGRSVQQTSDGGYVIAGYTEVDGADSADVWLIKTDVSGNKTWDRTFGGAGDDGASSVRQTADGGYIVAGFTESSGAGSHDVWLIKTDADGNKEWDRTFGGSGSDLGYSVQQTSDGGYIVAGSTWSRGGGLSNVWLIRTDADGNKEWDRTFGGAGCSVQRTSDGGCVVAGSTRTSGAGEKDVLLIKTDAEGN